ncbi:amino acid ABC transporter permease [Rhodoblastus sphagnicola]|uniref:Amino acid ABC transporter permease n=1 Tax=Rhodoblastus sphagnicola TaxID=333368 RepID=A0A2S6N5M3_9HYPH|nr:amino acid ABC transporter permease [Rhodoblastus sphagnicola]MBB4197222.1 general L-amino acid transport system permease protein [Rhodoblastus sphagnicola]PPQ29914.1 amino acid ABC transporter permease [Rhodoblastus sphagnicola]
MSDFLRAEFLSPLPPPPARGKSWREKLFGDARATAITLGLLVAAGLLLPPAVRYLFIDAVWTAPDGALCRAPGAGACWAYVAAKLPFFIYGAYPQPWRVNTAFLLALVLIVWLLRPRAKYKNYALGGFFIGLPVVGFILLHGAPALGLPVVGTNLWGGALVSLIMALAGMTAALPGGVALALGRRSKLPALRWLCVGTIEFVRGAPLIAVLFMANVLLPLFLPPDWAPDRLLRPLFGIALFASAYMAEVVRGGLAAVPLGQSEAAAALGFSRWQGLRLIVLPQALGAVVPGIVNNFVALFKDTTLVAIVGLFDFLHAIETARLDPAWAGPQIALTGYIFAAAFYLGFCLAMSSYARALEGRLAEARR